MSHRTLSAIVLEPTDPAPPPKPAPRTHAGTPTSNDTKRVCGSTPKRSATPTAPPAPSTSTREAVRSASAASSTPATSISSPCPASEPTATPAKTTDTGGTTTTDTVRLHTNTEDERRGFNRTENVRQIPPADPDFARLYARRNDAESINRHLDDTLWLRRAHSIGHTRQHLNLIGFALAVNSVALHEHRRHRTEQAA
jgi:hypothetical protein